MEPTTLVGPPEIHQQPPPAATTTAKSDQFMDLLVANFNTTVLPPRGLTEKDAPTFLSTGNPCLDFFFHVLPDTPPETLTQRLELAWNQDPLKALKLLCNLRGVRGTGKSDKEGGYTAALWLHNNHPKTLACNVASFADFGYFKDLLEILFRLLEGPDARKLAKEAHENWKQMEEIKKSEKEARVQWKQMKEMKKLYGKRFRGRGGYGGRRGQGYGRGRGQVRIKISDERKADIFKKQNGPKLSHEEKRIQKAKKAVERFNRDPDFKFLHDRVSDYFAQCLRSDMKMLESGESKQISLAAKWCPSLDSSYDQVTLLCETIAKKVFPRGEYPEYEGVEEAHYAYRVRDRLRKQVLVPLRKALELPEVYIGANDWGSIRYNRVASVAMKTLTQKFFKHDEQRFRQYLELVRSGKSSIAAGALLPHELLHSALYETHSGSSQVAELQWERMVDDMVEKGKMNNCLAVCDVSGSMHDTPMEVAVALGILVSELSEEPWKGKVITFSENPQLQLVLGESLSEKAEFVQNMGFGDNTNFQKVFDLLLQVAVNGKLKPDQMIKRLFVFSDMEFDVATENPWETDYQAIVRKFKESGYGECVPEIVFWNLRDSQATPVPSNQPGVALVSGFSKNLMTLFLEEGGNLDPAVAVMEDVNPEDADAVVATSSTDPESVMEAAISGEEYQKLVVID